MKICEICGKKYLLISWVLSIKVTLAHLFINQQSFGLAKTKKICAISKICESHKTSINQFEIKFFQKTIYAKTLRNTILTLHQKSEKKVTLPCLTIKTVTHEI